MDLDRENLCIVVEQLSKIDGEWWLRRVPEEIRLRAEQRKREEMEKLVRTHDLIEQRDPFRTLEYLAFASLLAKRVKEAKRTRTKG